MLIWTSRPARSNALHLLILLALSMFVAEAMIMFTLQHFNIQSAVLESIIDGALLTLALFPLLYFFVFRKLVRQNTALKSTEESLRAAHDNLKKRVAEHTNELQQAHSNLEESLTRFTDIAEVAGDWIWETDAELRFSYLSPRFFELFPLKAEDIIGKTREEFAGVSTENEVWGQHLDDLANRRPFRDYKYAANFPDGTIGHMLISGKPVFNDDGTFKCYRGAGTDKTDEFNAQKASQENEELFAKAFHASPAACAITKPDDGTPYDVNEAWVQLLGYSREEAIRHTALELGIWADPNERTHFVDLIKRNGSVQSFEAKFRAKDGTELDLLISAEMVEVGGGPRLFVVSHDITKQKKAEQALELQNQLLREQDALLKEQNQRFDAALTNISQGLCMFDVKQNLIVCNERWASIYGLSPEQVKPGTNLRQIFESRIANGIYEGSPEEYIKNAFESLPVGAYEKKYQHLNDGRIIEITHHPISNGGWVATHEEVTDRIQAEAMSQRLARIVEDSINEVFVFDAETLKFQQVNKSACNNLGYTMEELSELTPVDLKPEFTLEHFEDAIAPLRRGDEDHIRFQTIHRRKDGSHYDTDIVLQQIQSGDRPVFAAIIEDITERKKAHLVLTAHRDHLQEMVDMATDDLKLKAEELEAALAKERKLNELQRQFVSMASHEFRTPLSIIDTGAQRLMSRANKNQLTPEEAVKRAEKIRHAVGRMTRLMESTLTAARMDAGKVEINVEQCDLHHNILDVCAHQLELNEEHKIICDLKDLPDSIAGDSKAFDQIFTNLMSNAVKYSPDGPDIFVKGWRDGDYAVVTMQDRGLGIDKDDLPQMFSRFFRAGTSVGIAGTGIGLNLVKTLVELHGGSISVESKIGEGSTFTVRLPIAGPDQSERVDARVA